LDFLEWCQNSALGAAIRHDAWTIPAIEILHLAGVVLLFGSVLITNLRFLGRILTSEPAGPLAADLGRWTRAGLMLLAVTGPLLFFAMPKKLFETPDFAMKLALVAVAATYYFTIYRRRVATVVFDQAKTDYVKTAAAISLGLWIIAILAGLELGAFS
jgi:hypothetical protein